MQSQSLSKFILIAALVIVFGWFGIDKLVEPYLWIQWIPPWMDGLGGVRSNVWLTIIGVVEILFALLLLIPKRRVQQVAVVLMIGHLIGVLTQTGWSDIGVRDFGLLLSGAALLLLL